MVQPQGCEAVRLLARVAVMAPRQQGRKVAKTTKPVVKDLDVPPHSQYKYVVWQKGSSRYEGGWVAQVPGPDGGQRTVCTRQPTQLDAAQQAVAYLQRPLGKPAPTLADLKKAPAPKARGGRTATIGDVQPCSYHHVWWHVRTRRWYSRIEGQHLGYFDTEQDAVTEVHQ